MRRTIACATVLFFAVGQARAQSVPWEIVPSGSTIATTTDADAARVNMGAVPLASDWSLRLTHVSEVRARSTSLDADALTFTSPLLFGLAYSLGLSWVRPRALSGTGHVVSGEIGLAYAITRRMGLGARLRVSGAGGEADATMLNGAAALDVGFAWRPSPFFALGLRGLNLLGPNVPQLGVERAVAGGVGVRPTGDDAMTLGLDGAYAQSNTGWLRAGARVRVPHFGFLRAEGVLDLPSGDWRAGVGLEVAWGQGALGAGALFGAAPSAGGEGPLGFWASVRYEREREAGLPTPPVVVSVRANDELGSRAIARLVLRLERLRRDPAVRGIVFAPREDIGGLANAEELRAEFRRLRASGRRVVCHLTDATGAMYYACAAADSITMDPAGTLRMAGIRTSRYFLGDALASVGVRTQFVRIGAWKSAPEQFTRARSTPEALAQEEQLMDDFYASFLGGLSDSRHVVLERMRALVEGGPYTAREARRLGLVDALGSRETAERAAGRALEASVVEIDDYAPARTRPWAPGRAVAVVHVHGDIVDGESFDVPVLGLHFVGDRTIIPLLDRVAADPRYGAIVLRIDSSGGSAIASEMLWRAIERASRRKPLIASMGRMAASGGYYIAAPAREIFADPSTLTGSIGIFFGKADVANLLASLHVGVELTRRGAHADMDSVFRPYTDAEIGIISRHIRETYNVFLARVAAGRHMTTAAVDRVGEGRVFAGSRARQINLVDRLGGLADAVARARELAGLPEDAEVVELPPPPGGLLTTLIDALVESPAQAPTARLVSRSEVATAIGWLIAIAWAGQGRAMAMTEWPLQAP